MYFRHYADYFPRDVAAKKDSYRSCCVQLDSHRTAGCFEVFIKFHLPYKNAPVLGRHNKNSKMRAAFWDESGAGDTCLNMVYKGEIGGAK